ncbi:hypothetical protein GCM10009602_32630 [Nocardiopsis tropica]
MVLVQQRSVTYRGPEPLGAEGSEATAPDVVYDYTPYGERTSETVEGTTAAGLSPFGFTGAYQFQDGTVHLAHRFHSTFTLGFTQPDPSRQELNNHAYAACDPINNTDPTGLNACNLVTLVGIVATGAALAGAAPLSLILGVPAAVGGLICIGMWINDQAVSAA